MILVRASHTVAICSYFAILGLWFVVATTAVSPPNITCGPSDGRVITIDGSVSGVPLAKAWAKRYQQACLGTSITITPSDSRVGAQRMCGLSSAGSAVDIGIRSRPFQSNEAVSTNTDGYHFRCAQGIKTRTAIQVKVAINAFVFVVARNGSAAYCVEQLFGNGLTVEQIRILFSNYTPAQILEIPTQSPSYTPVTPTIIPFTRRPTLPPLRPCDKNCLILRPRWRPIPNNPPVRPRPPPLPPPSPRLTLPPPALIPIWGKFPHVQKRASVSSAEEFCTSIQALVAGPPTTFEIHQDFARSVLNDYGRGEGITSRYVSVSSTKGIVSYLQSHTNAIAFMSLPDYIAYQSKLQLVNVQDVGGINRAPNATGLYPLSYDIFMEVRSDDSATLARLRPLFALGYSSQGSADVKSTGLVPLSKSIRSQMLSLL